MTGTNQPLEAMAGVVANRLKPYSAYKDSGVEWLGKVPAHWEVRRLRNTVEMRVSNVDKHTKAGEESVRLCNYVDVYKNDCIDQKIDFMRGTATPREIALFRLKKDDVLITKDSETWDDIGVPALVTQPSDDLISGYHLALLRPFVNRLIGNYLLRALQSKGLSYQFHVEAKGVTRYGLSHAAIKSLWLPLPPLPEQTAIVRYLDYVDRRVRRLTQEKRKLVALLTEQKQAIIHRAVTRGLDPDVPMKDSGVEWLGEVPEHWRVRRLKQVCRFLYGDSLAGDVREHGQVSVYGSNGSVGSHVNANTYAPCIIVGRKGSFGKINYCDKPVFAIDTTFFIDNRVTSENIRWLFFVLKWLRLDEISKDAAVPGLSRSDAYNRIVLAPPLSEQTAIVEYLDKATAAIDAAIARANREIELLDEYRTRLFADVVTGKLDVREAAAVLPEVDPLAAENETDETGDETGLDEPLKEADNADAMPETAEV